MSSAGRNWTTAKQESNLFFTKEVKSHDLAKTMEKTKQNRIKKHIISSPMVNNSQSVPNELTQNIQFSIENFWIFFRNLTIMQAHQPGKKLYLPFCQSWL